MDNIDRLVDLKYHGITERDLEEFDHAPITWFTPEEDPAVTLMRIMRDPAHFRFTCKHLLNLDVFTFQQVVLRELWDHSFPLLAANRGFSKSFLLALYSVLRAFILPGTKIVITGMGFRQAKSVMNYAFGFWNNGPVFRSLYADHKESGPHPGNDRYVLRLGDSTITGLPMGDGQSIRGERANVVIGDEFASIARDIFETVVAGFGVVSQNVYEQVRHRAHVEVLKDLGRWTAEMEDLERSSGLGNQLIISGTCYYQFNHFYTYWKRYKQIVESEGDPRVLKAIFEADGKAVPDNLDHRQYAVIRIPMSLVPDGFMDVGQISRSASTMHSGTFNNEYNAVFSADRNGFFSRLLIESCVTTRPIVPFESDEPVRFHAVMRGKSDHRYVFGVDPASENDRLTVVVLEVHPTHRRVVHCWSMKREEYQKRVEASQTAETEYYGFIARKIRDLMKVFPCELIALDAQGGGVGVIEALGDGSKLQGDEVPIFPITPDHPLHDGKARTTDDWSGRHIVEMVQFANASYVSEANHKLRKDLEDKALLFPHVDSAVVAVASVEDELLGRLYDTQEDAVVEIEELKEELGTITHSQTPGSLRDHWDTPEIRLPGMKKGRLRKDRYSALLMANYAARRMARKVDTPPLEAIGGFIDRIGPAPDGGPVANGPDWYASAVRDCWDAYGCV